MWRFGGWIHLISWLSVGLVGEDFERPMEDAILRAPGILLFCYLARHIEWSTDTSGAVPDFALAGHDRARLERAIAWARNVQVRGPWSKTRTRTRTPEKATYTSRPSAVNDQRPAPQGWSLIQPASAGPVHKVAVSASLQIALRLGRTSLQACWPSRKLSSIEPAASRQQALPSREDRFCSSQHDCTCLSKSAIFIAIYSTQPHVHTRYDASDYHINLLPIPLPCVHS